MKRQTETHILGSEPLPYWAEDFIQIFQISQNRIGYEYHYHLGKQVDLVDGDEIWFDGMNLGFNKKGVWNNETTD